MDGDEPRNRKARRAAAKASGQPIAAPTTAPKIKMAQPDYSKPKGKTLLDVYNESSDMLQQGQPFDKKYQDGLARDENGNILESSEQVIGPVAEAFFWTISLDMLHFTLDVLTQNQYKQAIDWNELFRRSASMLPVLWLAVFMVRSRLAKRWYYARQAFFMLIAVGIGGHTISVANTKSYYAVMKRVPPLGTVWIYSVVEMDLIPAAVSLGLNLGWLLYNGYTVF